MVPCCHHLFLIIFLNFLPSIFSNLAADRAALLRLRVAVRGRTLFWNTASDTPCSWKGVACDDAIKRVTELRLPGDGLSGQLPLNSVGKMTELRVLSLRFNSLFGQLPSDLASCTHLRGLHLQENKFSGEIPDNFFTLRNLSHLNLSGNNFSGSLSAGFNNLTKLRDLYLEKNQFTGSLPDLSRHFGLRNFNVSFNGLTGPIPSSLGANFNSSSFLRTSLCGRPLASCPSKNGDKLSGGAIAGIAVGSVLVLVLTLIVLFILWRKYGSRKNRSQVQMSPVPPSLVNPPETWNPNSIGVGEEGHWSNNNLPIDIWNPEERKRTATVNGGSDGLVFFGEDVKVFSLNDLLKASAEVIGKGTVGSTYKAYLESGVEVIVKRLKNARLSEEAFRGKIEEVGSLVHENLEPLRGYFCGRDEKLLLYEPMPYGSLSALLHGNNKRELTWKVRAKIALGTARGLEYLHSISPGTTHGNVKSSNVFLTDYYDARVSDFGLTQLVSPISSLNGYRAPEVTDSRRTSQHADVYGFGVLLLELLTGKAPDAVLTEEGLELPKWVQSVAPEKWKVEVFDSDIFQYKDSEEELKPFLHLAVACTAQHPDRRPFMVEVTRRIEEICG